MTTHVLCVIEEAFVVDSFFVIGATFTGTIQCLPCEIPAIMQLCPCTLHGLEKAEVTGVMPSCSP
jgi:hypothetical protein